jgi:dipeptidase D
MEKFKGLGGPSEFWDYFYHISKTPRCSGKEEKIREYIRNEAEKLNYKTKIDEVGNLVIKIPAPTEKEKVKIILQCHMDMVCEKNENSNHNFSKDPIKLKVIELEGEKWLTAEGTTLGADNGVGIAYLLTFMKKVHSNELRFESIAFNLLFTVNEEMGLLGAFQIERDLVNGDYLINLDSEEDNRFTIGCAGGINTLGEIKIKYEEINNYTKKALPIKLSISGLKGGHSGVDIHKGHANAIKLLSKFLWKLNDKYSIHVHVINGGNLSNAIPREANSIFYTSPNDYPEVMNLINKIRSETIIEFSNIEPNMKIEADLLQDFYETKIIPAKIKDNILHILYVMPNGPIAMHPNISNLVYTSTNLASIKTDNDGIKITTSQRSLHEISKQQIYEEVEALLRLADVNIKMKHIGDYPGWDPDFNSYLLMKAKETYKTLFNDDVIIQAIHAGLECGILKKQFPAIDMISLGPTIINAHSPDERLKIQSIEKIWRFLIELITYLH